ncbi:unnamed protein product [Prorocentrum cordatum]|uniref:Uncharacterized protein n=1 Tax=Prorocentrum cordatum TaxID=2364126 RepID=A0ABN9WAB2_9DINO|nr:unnamed protein product [Polarella glacialis]
MLGSLRLCRGTARAAPGLRRGFAAQSEIVATLQGKIKALAEKKGPAFQKLKKEPRGCTYSTPPRLRADALGRCGEAQEEEDDAVGRTYKKHARGACNLSSMSGHDRSPNGLSSYFLRNTACSGNGYALGSWCIVARRRAPAAKFALKSGHGKAARRILALRDF